MRDDHSSGLNPMKEQWFELTLGVLATWRVSHLVAREEGPWDVVLRLRRAAGSGMIGRVMDCPYCTSIWIAGPLGLLLGTTWPERGLWWLALSGGASVIERWWETREVQTRELDAAVEETTDV